MLIMSADSWRSLQNGLYRKFPEKASLIILEMGFDYGSNLGTSILGEKTTSSDTSLPNSLSSLPSPEQIAEVLTEVVKRVGWGVLTISGELKTGTSVSFAIDNCGFCVQSGASTYPCNFFRGTALGITSRFYSREYLSSTTCSIRNGVHHCEISLVRK